MPTRVGKYVKTGSIVRFTLTGDRRGIYAENFTLWSFALISINYPVTRLGIRKSTQFVKIE